jgi:hypothetical protein
MEERTCKFAFQVRWHAQRQHWCIPKTQAGNHHHCGHVKRDANECRLFLKDYGNKNLEKVKDQLQVGIRPTQIAALAKLEFGHAMNEDQIRGLRSKLRDSTCIRLSVIDQLAGRAEETHDPAYKPTSADRLIANLEKDNRFSYTAIYGHHDSNLLKVYKRRGIKGRLATTEEIPASALEDNKEKAATYVENIRNELKVGGEEACTVLLAIAWTNDEGQRKFSMWPEFSASDVTHGTNSEKRPLLLYCSQDGNNESFTHTWAFLPSQARWVFNWFFSQAIPTLHCADTLKRNYLHATDQDMQECGAFEDARRTVFINAKHRLCSFHKINRNFSNDPKYRNQIELNRREGVSSQIELRLLEVWLYKFIKEYEVGEESDQSYAMFRHYLTEGSDNHDGELHYEMAALANGFLTERFHPHENRLFNYVFQEVCGMEKHTSSINEAENKALKYSANGPKPYDNLDAAQLRISENTDEKERKKQRKAGIAMNTKAAKEEDRTWLLYGLTQWCNNRILDQTNASKSYEVWRCDGGMTFLVRRHQPEEVEEEDGKLPATKERTTKQNKETRTAHRCRWYIPNFCRTRTVKIVKQHGRLVGTCNCGFFKRNLFCCRHIYACLTRGANHEDANIRYWSIYNRDFLRWDDDITEILRAIRDDTPLDGVPVRLEDLRQRRKGKRPFEWFEEARKASILRGPSYWTNHPIFRNIRSVMSAKQRAEAYGSPMLASPRRPVFGPVDVSVATHLSPRALQLDRLPDAGGVTEHESDTEFPAEAEMTVETAHKLIPSNAYEVTSEQYGRCCNKVQNKAQLEFMMSHMEQMENKLSELSTAKMTADNHTGGLLSQPAVDHRRVDKRRTKKSSPKKKKSNKNTGNKRKR